MIMMIDDVLEEVLCFWQMFKDHCLILSSLQWGNEWHVWSSKDECESTSKQLKYIEQKQEYEINEWDYQHSTLSKGTSEWDAKT